jgi:uncharacterized membrane protein
MKFDSNLLNRIFHFYYDGFRNMSGWGKKLWLIIIIKLFIMFVILKIFFFHDFLNRNYDNNRDRSEHVRNQLLNSPRQP